MNNVTRGIAGCDAYIDDIVLYSSSWEDHLIQIRSLFARLSDANLTINLSKSVFARAEVTYLGHVVGNGKVKPIQAKIEAIQRFPVPNNRREVMRFLGTVGFYRKFCKNFSDVSEPMTNLLRKDVKFVWSDTCQKSFDKLKSLLVTAPVLLSPDCSKQFKLCVDASDIGAGSVLFQQGASGIDQPVCYFSKMFDRHQRNYSTIEKETLALILFLQHFDVYLHPTLYPVLVFTDHNPLKFLDRMYNKNQRLMRWSLLLQEYRLEIQHIRGVDNIMADALSRSWVLPVE